MEQYYELLQRVITLETELQVLRVEQANGNPPAMLLARINGLESQLYTLKSEIIQTNVGEQSFEAPAEKPPFVVPPAQVGVSEFRVRNAQGYGPPTVGYETPPNNVVAGPKKNVELQIGKTIMSILATLLILFSLVSFGILVFPFISDFGKALIMYVVSIILAEVGLFLREKRNKGFFTALAGCGIAAFYISNVISCFVFNIFGLEMLFILTYAWIIAVAWTSRDKVPIFAAICYVGIVVSTVLCLTLFSDSVLGLVCYLASIVPLYLFNRMKDYKKDAIYFLQLVICLCLFAWYYYENLSVVIVLMAIGGVVYIAQRYLYREVNDAYKACLLATELLLIMCYFGRIRESVVLNLAYILIAGLIALWSYVLSENRFSTITPLCIFCAILPVLRYGDFYTDYISFAPFAAGILALGYLLNIDMLKGISCGYMLAYVFIKPELLGYNAFYIVCLMYIALFAICYYTRAFGRHLDAVAFMGIFSVILTSMMYAEALEIVCFSYWVMVLASIVFNSKVFVKDDFIQRLGWAWNGYCMLLGSAYIMNNDDILSLSIFFLAVLIAYTINVRWQLECEHPFAGVELCLKCSAYLGILMYQFAVSGVGLSIAFLLLAIGCIVLGFYKKRKSIRLYGLIMTVCAVVKALLVDIAYSSSILLPVGLLVAGLLCFGISYVYSVFERKLHDSSEAD